MKDDWISNLKVANKTFDSPNTKYKIFAYFGSFWREVKKWTVPTSPVGTAGHGGCPAGGGSPNLYLISIMYLEHGRIISLVLLFMLRMYWESGCIISRVLCLILSFVGGVGNPLFVLRHSTKQIRQKKNFAVQNIFSYIRLSVDTKYWNRRDILQCLQQSHISLSS